MNEVPFSSADDRKLTITSHDNDIITPSSIPFDKAWPTPLGRRHLGIKIISCPFLPVIRISIYTKVKLLSLYHILFRSCLLCSFSSFSEILYVIFVNSWEWSTMSAATVVLIVDGLMTCPTFGALSGHFGVGNAVALSTLVNPCRQSPITPTCRQTSLLPPRVSSSSSSPSLMRRWDRETARASPSDWPRPILAPVVSAWSGPAPTQS